MAAANGTALLLIDVINAFAFPGSRPLIRAAEAATPRIASLVRAARESKVPVVYVNDNFGQWVSDFKSTVAECTRPNRAGHVVAERLRPAKGDYFVLKPQ